MPYIPEEHKKYPVLPYSRVHGGEVFQYHSEPHRRLTELVGEHLMPYGYSSYEEYLKKIDNTILAHQSETETIRLLENWKKKIIEWNRKEEWSICKYLGEDTDAFLGLHHGGYYYWQCTLDDPEFGGIIDDEEFTAYLYPTDPDLWEIIVDPSGMAQRTIYDGEN